jgi:hypothetical protein
MTLYHTVLFKPLEGGDASDAQIAAAANALYGLTVIEGVQKVISCNIGLLSTEVHSFELQSRNSPIAK